MDKKIIAIFAIIVLAVGGAAFFGGMKYGQSKSGGKFSDRMGSYQNGMPGSGPTGAVKGSGSKTLNGGMIAGEILSKDDKSLTVKSADGSSKIIFFSQTTKALEEAETSLDKLAVGQQITVNGSSNSDGSVNAQSIQIRPSAQIK
ncbi:MAG: DUF5666 domain-containing protein [Candidatus Paceibacterota bacterium]|jgi:hypothetical protein